MSGFVANIVSKPDAEDISAHAKLYIGVDRGCGDYQDIELKSKEEREIMKIRPKQVETLVS